jgi:hypothetical protein
VYTHALDFGSDTTRALVNGVQFQAGGSTFGGIAGTSATVGTGSTTITAAHAGNSNAAGLLNGTAACGMEGLVKDMNYNNSAGTINLTGLTPGVHYQFRLYHRAWGTAAASRSQNIGFDTDGVGVDITGAEVSGTFNEDDARAPSPSFATFNQVYAYTLDYKLAPGVTALKIYINRTGTGTYHLYGLTNEQFATSSAVVHLDGTASLPGGGQTTTSWTVVSGPASVTFGNAAAVDTTATFTQAGTYVLRLTANNGTNQVTDDVTVTVDPAAASPAFGDIALEGARVTKPKRYPSRADRALSAAGGKASVQVSAPGYRIGNHSDRASAPTMTIDTGHGYAQVSAYQVWAVGHARALNENLQLDQDGDGWIRFEEFSWGLDPFDVSSFDVWVSYQEKVASLYDPGMDTDGDGLTNGDEFVRKLDPIHPDLTNAAR